MNSTSPLNVISDFKLKDQMIIHPNDGADLDLMNISYKVKIISLLSDNQEKFDGEIFLDNKCKHGNMVLGTTFWQKIGRPHNIKVSISDDKKIIYLSK
jgi:hypothetical protein